MYVYSGTGAPGAQDQPFQLDIGVPVKPDAQIPPQFIVIDVPASQCATVLFTGTDFSQAYVKIYGYVKQHGLHIINISREVYLYWEDRQSNNNVVQLQVQLEPAP